MPRPKKAPPPTHEEHVFHIREPSLSYGFRIEHDRRRREWRPFDESQSVHFVTECIWPDRLKGREGKATLYPEPDLLEPEKLPEDDVHRKWIGHVHATTRPAMGRRTATGCRWRRRASSSRPSPG